MIDGHSVTAIVAGRGGSKGLRGKNIADLGGQPLVSWSVAAAQHSKRVDKIAVSSDDEDILNAAVAAGCEIRIDRPKELATDEASIHDAVVHALDTLGCSNGFVVLLQATSPLRTATDIDTCIEACAESGAPSAVTLAPAGKPPQWVYRMDGDGALSPVAEDGSLKRRQDFEQLYVLNGAVYVAHVGWYREHRRFLDDDTVGVVMSAERSIDIDTAYDLAVARMLVNQTKED